MQNLDKGSSTSCSSVFPGLGCVSSGFCHERKHQKTSQTKKYMRRLFFDLNVCEAIQQCLQKLPPSSCVNEVGFLHSTCFAITLCLSCLTVSPTVECIKPWWYELLRLILLPPRRPLKGHLACPFEKHACPWPIHLPSEQRWHEYTVYIQNETEKESCECWLLSCQMTIMRVMIVGFLPIAWWCWFWIKINELYASKPALFIRNIHWSRTFHHLSNDLGASC